MTDGEGQNLSSGQGIPDDEAPVPSGGSKVAVDHPLADNQFDVGAFIDRLKVTALRFKDSPLLQIFIGLVVFWTVWTFFFGAMDAVAAVSPGFLAAIIWVVGCLVGFVQWALTPIFLIAFAGFQAVLYKPMAQRLFDRSADLEGPVALAKSQFGNFFKAVVSMLPILLTTCCAPLSWLAAFFLGQAPYLVVVRDYEVMDALKESFERSKRHWHVLLMSVGFMFAVTCVAALIALPFGALSFVGGFIHPVISTFLWPLPFMVLVVLTMVGGFIISSAAFATIDELEGLDTIDAEME